MAKSLKSNTVLFLDSKTMNRKDSREQERHFSIKKKDYWKSFDNYHNYQ